MDANQIEAAIEAKGLTARRVTPHDIEAVIVRASYHVFPDTTLTVCALTLRNGFVVMGESACASPENFDIKLGEQIARDSAKSKVWALEGYRLKQAMSEGC